MEERRNRMRTTMRTNDNIRMHEFIGLDAEVLQATCPTLVGKKGCVVDETRNTLRLRIAAGKDAGNAREIIVPKLGTVFLLRTLDEDAAGGSVATKVEGDGIIHRPEERIKRVGIAARKEGRGRGGRRARGPDGNDVHQTTDR